MQCDTPCDAGPLQQAPAPSQPHGHKGKQLILLYTHTTILFVTLGTKMLLKAVHPLPGGKEEVKPLLTQFFFFFPVASHGLEEHIKHYQGPLDHRSYWFLANRPCRVKCCALPKNCTHLLDAFGFSLQ